MVKLVENEKPTIPQLQPDDLQKVLWYALKVIGGGIQIPKQNLDNFPKDCDTKIVYDADKKAYIFVAEMKEKRGRGIIAPKRKLIIPN